MSINDEQRIRYESFLKSSQWKNIRRDIFKLRGHRCERCGRYSPDLEVHHLTYDRFGGNELPSDLKIVCKQCHKKEDEERVDAALEYREEARIEAAFLTWLEKVNGSSKHATAEDRIRFEEWIEKKENQ